jgi:predicted  nucleic acid-binding Zn-ribbon protein
MDQPGNSHYSLNMSQQTLNGHGGYHGRGYEANGHEGNGREANGYACNGYADGMPPDHHAADGAPGTVADAGIEDGTQTSADGIDHDATVTDEGRGPADQDPADQDPADQDPADQDAGEPATDVAPDGLDGQDATGTADGEPAASGDSLNGTRAADRMRELLARSTVDHAATGRATAITLDGIRERLAGLEHAVAEIAERAEAERGVADRVAEQLAPQAQRLAGMSATLDGLTASLSTFRAQISGIDGRLAEADSRLAGADVKLASTEGRVTALDTRFERLDERLDDQYDRVSSIDERVTSIDGRVTSIGERVAAADGRIIALGGQFTDAIAPLADELRARPDRTEIEEVITKIVAAAHTDLSTRLTSLEDTVLTLAEALLRPAPGHAPGHAPGEA